MGSSGTKDIEIIPLITGRPVEFDKSKAELPADLIRKCAEEAFDLTAVEYQSIAKERLEMIPMVAEHILMHWFGKINQAGIYPAPYHVIYKYIDELKKYCKGYVLRLKKELL